MDFHLALSFSQPPIAEELLLGRTACMDSGLRDAKPRKLVCGRLLHSPTSSCSLGEYRALLGIEGAKKFLCRDKLLS